jgi:hypothetical protein
MNEDTNLFNDKIIGTIEVKKGLIYSIDKHGNITERKYSIFRDKWTILTLVIIILGAFYYLEVSRMVNNEKNFGESCDLYSRLKSAWYVRFPNEPLPSVRELMKYRITNDGNLLKENEQPESVKYQYAP